MQRNPQVVISRELHAILKKAAFTSGVPIYKLVDVILRPTLKNPDKLEEATIRAKSLK